MNIATRFSLIALATLAASTAYAQAPPKALPIGTKVTMLRPADGEEVLMRLIGLRCVSTTKLTRNGDGSYVGTVNCGVVQISAKQLSLEIEGQLHKIPTPDPVVAMSDPKITSGQVTVLEIGPSDLFVSRASEIVGKVCTVSKPLTRDANGFYAGELTCGASRYYFAAVKVAAGAVTLGGGALAALQLAGDSVAAPQPGERWRITSAGDVYTTINTTDCLQWPSLDARRRGGEDTWGAYAPVNGDIGVVLGSARHCSQAIDIVFLQIGSVVVPIGAQGIERVR